MSRSDHTLRSAAWYGDWARMFHRENREMREFGRRKRERDRRRSDGHEFDTHCDIA